MSPTHRTIAFQAWERNVFLHLLTACNLSCRHCYINPDQHGRQTLPLATIIDWLRLFHRPGSPTNLVLLGGEPTLHPDLPEAIRAARDIGYRSITVDTNGFVFHDFLNRVGPDEAVVSFSLDGPDPDTNDPIRGAGVFATCVANLRRAVQIGFETSVICTVSAANLASLPRMPRLLADLGARHFFLQVIGLRGQSGAAGARLQLSHEQWLSVVPAVAEDAARLGLHVIYPKVFLDPGEPFACAGIAADNVFVFPNGRVYRCPLCEDHPIHSMRIDNNQLIPCPGLTESRFFQLTIPEGCVMNKLLQPSSIDYDATGMPLHRISCCLLKHELLPIP